MKSIFARAAGALSSFGLACIVLLLLMVLTFFGTLEQAEHSLYDVQKKYFESLFVLVYPLPVPVPIPLPGAYLLLSVLFLNLLVGGLVRLRRSWSRVGILLIHVGIAALLLGGFVEYKTSTKGHLTLFEGEGAGVFKSYFEWELVVRERLDDGSAREYVIPDEDFAGLAPGESAEFNAQGLPFEVVLSGFLHNCRPRPLQGSAAGIDGFVLEELAREKTAEANVAGMTATLVARSGEQRHGLLWGLQREPWSTAIEGRPYQVDLRKRSFELPFRVELREFTRDLHPGTGMAKAFASDVTCLTGNVAQDVRISMNEPLRREGFTLYQASWGPSDARPGDALFSTFAVVENPADRVPLVACIVIALGLLAHFVPVLVRHIRNQAARPS